MNRFEDLRNKILPVLHPDVKWVAVFGSFARGEETADSDLDILVKLKPRGSRPPLGLKWFDLEVQLSRILGRQVELVSDSALSPYIRPYAQKDMVLLYEESGYPDCLGGCHGGPPRFEEASSASP